MNRDYYVYAHFDEETNELVYIGKGVGDRAWKTAGRLKEHQDMMNRSYAKGYSGFIEILFTRLTNEQALQCETIHIQERKPKFNQTHTEEWYERLRKQSLEQAQLRCKKCLTPDGEFDSMKDVADFYNLAPATVSARFGTVKEGKYKLEGWDIVTV